MSPEDVKESVISTLEKAAECFALLENEFDEFQLEDGAISPKQLQNELKLALKLLRKTRPLVAEPIALPKVIEDLKDREIRLDSEGKHAHIEITQQERHAICLGYEFLTAALAPFTSVEIPPSFKDGSEVRLQVIGDVETAKEWATEWDVMKEFGTPPAWPRPDVESNKDFPVATMDGSAISIVDVRYAITVKLALENNNDKNNPNT